MNTYLCRWPGGSLSILNARDRDHAIIVLDEFSDASEAELFETENLLIDFSLNDSGHLEFRQFGERLHNEVMEQAYPLLHKAMMEDKDELEDFPEAASAEKERLNATLVDETHILTRNIAIARLAANEALSLEHALTKYTKDLPILSPEWRDLANKVSLNNRQILGYDGTNLRALTLPFELPKLDDEDPLPVYLLAAVLADDMDASVLTVWQDLKDSKDAPIGNFWEWMAHEVRQLPETVATIN